MNNIDYSIEYVSSLSIIGSTEESGNEKKPKLKNSEKNINNNIKINNIQINNNNYPIVFSGFHEKIENINKKKKESFDKNIFKTSKIENYNNTSNYNNSPNRDVKDKIYNDKSQIFLNSFVKNAEKNKIEHIEKPVFLNNEKIKKENDNKKNWNNFKNLGTSNKPQNFFNNLLRLQGTRTIQTEDSEVFSQEGSKKNEKVRKQFLKSNSRIGPRNNLSFINKNYCANSEKTSNQDEYDLKSGYDSSSEYSVDLLNVNSNEFKKMQKNKNNKTKHNKAKRSLEEKNNNGNSPSNNEKSLKPISLDRENNNFMLFKQNVRNSTNLIGSKLLTNIFLRPKKNKVIENKLSNKKMIQKLDKIFDIVSK